MRLNMKKVAATAMAMAMCFPVSALAAATAPASQGSFETSFDIYSPALTFTVPVNLDVKVNPLADSTATGVKKFTVASNSIDIVNASVDVEADAAIPVNVTIQATVETKEGVVSEYNTFNADNTSTKKRIYLDLAEAQTAAIFDLKTSGTATFDNDKKLDLSQYAVKTPAVYSTPATTAPITAYGSLLSLDIAGPSTTDATAGATFSTDATKVTPAVGSFAVTGVANGNADWKEDDVAVAVTYNVKASSPLNIAQPTITTAPTFTAGTGAADVSITVPNVGEATVDALVIHNAAGAFEDYIWDAEAFEVDYTTTPGTAIVKIPKEDEALGIFAEAVSGEAQDLVIVLSDGRRVVTTFTANVAANP